LGLAAIFTYGFDISDANLAEATVDYFTLSNYDSLLQEAINRGVIREGQLNSLQAWRGDPTNWGSAGQ